MRSLPAVGTPISEVQSGSRGRRVEFWLGGFSLVSLKDAREKSFANRKHAYEGSDPLSEKRRVDSTPTFTEATQQF